MHQQLWAAPFYICFHEVMFSRSQVLWLWGSVVSQSDYSWNRRWMVIDTVLDAFVKKLLVDRYMMNYGRQTLPYFLYVISYKVATPVLIRNITAMWSPRNFYLLTRFGSCKDGTPAVMQLRSLEIMTAKLCLHPWL